jgi:trimeric autotransporter adhesin
VRRISLLVLSSVGCLLFLSGCGGSNPTSSTSTPQPPSSGGSSNPTPNPTPSIASITPASLVAGSASQTITVAGSGFITSTVVSFNGTALTTTYVSGTSVTAVLPGSAIAADGTEKITVSNPAPGGGTSPVQSYSITVPTPGVTSLLPQSVPQGAAVTVTVNGKGFEANSVAQWNGVPRPTTFVNATTLQVALTAADVQNFGTGNISVVNPSLAATTPLDLAIIATTPTITSISPSSIAVYTGSNIPQHVFIGGSGFAANATVQANGQLVPAVSQTATSISVSLAASYFATAGSINIVVSNPGSPVVSSNQAVLRVVAPSPATLSVTPNSAPVGSPDTTITLSGSAFFQDSVVNWNNTPLSTKYVSTSRLTAVVPASLLAGFVQASVSVSTAENSGQTPPPQPFDTYLALPVNDIVYNSKDGFIYASVPGSAGENLGNTIAAIDPITGVVQKTIFVGSEPNRVALSDDGTQLFVGLNGAGAVRQVNLTNATASEQFSLGGGPGVYNPPYTAVSLAAVPGQPNSVAVYGTNGVVTIFDSGVARPNTSSGLETYFNQNLGALAFGSSASTLYIASNAISGYLYKLTIDATGVMAKTQLSTGTTTGNTMQYDNGRLYIPAGIALDATTGAQVGQFSLLSGTSTNPVAAAGPIVSDSTLNRAWIVPSNYGNSNQLLSFDEGSFNPVQSIALTGINNNISGNVLSRPADLIRWGQNGLAFHTVNQLYVIHGPIVKDISSSPADLAVTLQAPATQTTGSVLTYTVQVQNLGPNAAQGVTLTATLPQSVIFGGINPTQGTCNGSGEFYCDLGSIASGSAATVTVSVTPTDSGTLQTTAVVSSVSYDPVSSNNQVSASTTVSGSLFSAPPVVRQLSPALVQAGSNTFTLTVDGSGFSSASTVLWNGQSLATTLVSSGQLTATIDSSLVKQLGWSQISVSTAAPGGGQSTALPFSIYQLVNVPANAIAFDPFTRKLYAVLPSTSSSLSGNSIVAIDPATGSVGTPVQVGSEPNMLSETSDGNFFYIGLSGAKSLGRFNLLNQSLDLTVPLPNNASYGSTNAAAVSIATVPGSDTTLAVEINGIGINGIGIFDISGNAGTFRKKSSLIYDGNYPVFADPTHFYAYDAVTSGAEFYRYTVDANGAELIDGTSLDGMGGFGGRLAVDGGLAYGSGGGIVNPATTPPSQVGVLPLGSGISGTSFVGGGVLPYAAESKSFNIAVNVSGTTMSYIERFDTQHFTLEEQLQLPFSNFGSIQGTRWGQDGLAYIIPSSSAQNSPAQIFLVRGPFVLPSEAVANQAPSISSTDHNTIPAGSGNLYVTVTGSGFLPGATVLWNGSPRTTTYTDNGHVTVAIPASDTQTAGTVTLSSQNPGSGASNTINITVQ